MNFEEIVQNIRQKMPKVITKALPKEIAVISVPTQKSKVLNQVYRGKNTSTNVLSFYYDKSYGEIIVCPSVVREEAKKQGNTYTYQMTWMIVHGMLHLAGMHHEKSEFLAKNVEALEEQVLEKIEGK